jgi:arginase
MLVALCNMSPIQIISAPSILGLRPSGVQHLASSLLSGGLKEKLHADNDVSYIPVLNHCYSNDRSEHLTINQESLKTFSERLSKAVGHCVNTKKFALILGGDCSILIGAMHALKEVGNYGLIFLDAHADFYLPHQSVTGEAADMDLAIVTGRGPGELTDMNGRKPFVEDRYVIHIGQRDQQQTDEYHSQRIEDTAIKRFSLQYLNSTDVGKAADEILTSALHMNVEGFWIHFDTDVINDDENPAVDYRLPHGVTFEETSLLLKQLLAKLPVLGMTVTIYNPSLDCDKVVRAKLTELLVSVIK